MPLRCVGLHRVLLLNGSVLLGHPFNFRALSCWTLGAAERGGHFFFNSGDGIRCAGVTPLEEGMGRACMPAGDAAWHA